MFHLDIEQIRSYYRQLRDGHIVLITDYHHCKEDKQKLIDFFYQHNVINESFYNNDLIYLFPSNTESILSKLQKFKFPQK